MATERKRATGTRRGKGRYFHVTHPSNAEDILRHGLRGGRRPRHRGKSLRKPSIFVLTTSHQGVADDLAIDQLWPLEDIEEYAVIEIDPAGVTGQVQPDRVAETTAPFQRMIEQDVIRPAYLKLARRRRLRFPGRRLMDIQQAFLTRNWSAEEWRLARKWSGPMILAAQSDFETRGLNKTATRVRRRSTATTRR